MNLCIVKYAIPVSYTHLDVYKRQVSAYRMDRDSGKSRVDGVFPLDLR